MTVNSDNPESPQYQIHNDPDPVMTLIRRGDYEQAESMASNLLGEQPGSIALLERLDIALNGQGKTAEADMVRYRIIAAWHKHHKESWIERGSPSREASWKRIVRQHNGFIFIIAEFYTPVVIGEAPYHITVNYQCSVIPDQKGGAELSFRLEHSDLIDEYYVLREVLPAGGRQLIIYDHVKPTIHELANDLVNYLEKYRNSY